ncbi:MAG TPA: hypothetical protein VHE14_00225 [Solirubrobacteraceae bacterium]|nr:hypothetical protein [Solirubrobacteraceae bacterium]
MPRRSRHLFAPACALAVCAALAVPSAAAANAFSKVLKDYQVAGKIDPCKHSDKELREAQREVPNDIQQYAPDLPAALAAALAARARGDCDKHPKAAGGVATPATPAPPSTAAPPGTPGAHPTPAPPAAAPKIGSVPRTSPHSARSTPAPIIALAAVGGLLLATGLGLGLASLLGLSFPWTARMRHAWAEAGWRAGGVWGDFRDWVRIGG